MGILYVVATPIGNLNDISLRAIDILKSVDIIACEDTRQSLKLLNHYEIKKKLTSYHKFNESGKSNIIIDDLKNGKDVAIITDAGTPCISDPGYVLIREAHNNGITVIGIPGASAVITALSISGLDTSEFSFIGFLPTDSSKFNSQIDKMISSEIRTFVIYESPKRIVKLIEKLKNIFVNSHIFIASDLTKIHERNFNGKIEEVYETIKNDSNIEKGEYVVVLEKASIDKEKEDNTISYEAQIIDIMTKEQCTIKDAIKIICDNNKKIKKNDLYEASLNLKKIMNQ